MEKKIKVLHILNELNPSGAEVMLKVVGPIWKDYGITSEILSTGKKTGDFSEILTNSGYKIHHIPFSKSFLFFYKFFFHLKTEQYDIVHIHTETANFWVALVTKISGVKKIVRTIHSIFNFKGSLRIRRSLQRQILNKIGIQHISIGPSVKLNEEECFKNKTKLISNWYDNNSYYPPQKNQKQLAREKIGIDDSKFVIISVGNCSPIKNHTYLIREISNINNKDYLYLHIGKEDHNNSERNLAKELGISNQVRFYGFENDILPFLHASDLYIMCSTHEGFSIAALEALSTGLPAILTNVPGLKDFKDISDSIQFIELTDQELTKKINDIIENKTKSRININQSNKVQDIFGFKTGISKYVALYKD